MPVRTCECCNYSTSHKGKFDKHMNSAKHCSNFVLSPTHVLYANKQYVCDVCKYGTDTSSGFAIHCKSAKHKANMGNTQYKCMCGEFFFSKRAMGFHVKKCSVSHDMIDMADTANMADNANMESVMESGGTELIIAELMKQNKQLIDIMSAQSETLISRTEQHDKQIATLVESIQTGLTKNTQNIEHNTLNQNTQINLNLNVFVDEKCKDAMNLSEFIEQMEVHPEDLQTVLRVSNPKALNAIFTREIGKLELTERPLHCIDKKRKKILVRENDAWTSETGTARMEEVLEATRLKQWGEFRRQLMGIHAEDRATQKYQDIVDVAVIVGKPKKERYDNDPNGRIMQEALNSMCDAIPLTKSIARQILATDISPNSVTCTK
jgi:hypothetical protein